MELIFRENGKFLSRFAESITLYRWIVANNKLYVLMTVVYILYIYTVIVDVHSEISIHLCLKFLRNIESFLGEILNLKWRMVQVQVQNWLGYMIQIWVQRFSKSINYRQTLIF